MTEELTAEDFQNAIDEYWHGRPPSSLEDVMALYGVLAIAEGSGDLYTTPSELDRFVDDGRLVSIYVDLTGAKPEVTDIDQVTLRDDHVDRLNYSHKSSGRGSKYSITQIGSVTGNDADGVAGTSRGTLGKLSGWFTQNSIEAIVEEGEHPDTWLIEELASVFEKDSDSLDHISQILFDLLPADESIPTVLTVQIRVDPTTLESVDGREVRWFWPAEVGIFDEAMRRYATANAADKNIDSGPPSEGEGVGLVTGEPDRVVGTPESPLGVFSVKHPDAQPGLRKEQSWRHYPVSPDVAMLFAKGQSLVDSCVYRRGGMETYALPYFAGELTGEKAEVLYAAIQSVDGSSEYDESGDPPMAHVTFRLREHADETVRELAERELRFYTVTMPISDDKNVVAEEPAASVYWLAKLSDALAETVNGPTLDPVRGGFTTFDNWPLLEMRDLERARKTAFDCITSYTFTDAVFAYRDDDEGDDFRRIVDHRLIAGTPIDASVLFDEYLRRYDDASDDGEPPSAQVVAQQLVHLETLSRAGLLDGIDVPIESAETPMQSETDFNTTDIAAIREHRLESFLDRPLFAASPRRAAALAGVLIGQISWHQDSVRNIGRPLDSTTRGDQLSKNGLENALTAALEKAKIYAQDSERSFDRDVLFPETIDRLLEVTEDMPTNWDIEKRELQFCYVLGHAYGRRSMPVAFDLHEGGETDAVAATEPEEGTAN
jgi:CRISPR-associated protein Cas8b/Csh1 subtype I-B